MAMPTVSIFVMESAQTLTKTIRNIVGARRMTLNHSLFPMLRVVLGS